MIHYSVTDCLYKVITVANCFPYSSFDHLLFKKLIFFLLNSYLLILVEYVMRGFLDALLGEMGLLCQFALSLLKRIGLTKHLLRWHSNPKFKRLMQFQSRDMFTSEGHIKKPE